MAIVTGLLTEHNNGAENSPEPGHELRMGVRRKRVEARYGRQHEEAGYRSRGGGAGHCEQPVGTSPTGDFAGQAGRLAARIEGAWVFYAPNAGWSVYNLSNGMSYRYNGSAWVVPVVALPAQPFLEVSGPGTWTFDNTAWTKIPLTTIATDTSNGWDATSNTDYVIPQAGMYLVQGIVRPARSGGDAFPDSTAFAAGIGTAAADGDDVSWAVSPGVAGALFTVQVESLRRYIAGDRVSLFAKHSATSPIAISRARLRILRLTD